jgi:S-DNA-T family DNA segregation ATPase FtsK/SpoIIIE
MSVIDRSAELSLWSEDLRNMLRRRLRECLGVALVMLAVMVMLALGSWSVLDPSLSHATNAPVRNLLGRPGAIVADLMMQLFGIAALSLVLPIAVYGCRLIAHRPLGYRWWRFALWAAGILLISGFASCLPRTASWPLPTGLGGVLGDALLRPPAFLFGPLSGWTHIGVAMLFAVISVVAFIAAAGTAGRSHAADDADWARRAADTAEETDEEPERTSISLGWLVHSLLSLKSRMTRLLNGRAAPVEARIDPRLVAPAPEPKPQPEPAQPQQAEPAVDESAATAGARRARSRGARRSGGYELPPLSLLAAPKPTERYAPSPQSIQETAARLESVLADFGVRGSIINARPGPVVTLYELEPAPGIKSSRVIGLADDIARSMSALSARVAVVSGRNAIGIELPNEAREKVYLRELLASPDYEETSAKLPLCLGKTIGGESVIVDLARMPHLLIAGTTGSGKSVAINTMILSLLYRLRPDQCRLIMVDPKMLELSVYEGIPHLLTPVVTDPKKAVIALKWAVREMEERYKRMSKLGVRNIDGYNARIAEARLKGDRLTRTVHTGYDRTTGEAIYETEELELEPLPYVVVVVDEMADLMMVAGKDIEGAIQRLAQMARAAGIHVILATQRPSVDVITGTIKANFPTRISFQVTSKIDSRTILGEQGAEQLLGQGDMLYMAGGGRISRVHGPFVSDEEVEKVVRHLKTQGVPQYLEAVTAEDEHEDAGGAVFDSTSMGSEGEGDLYQQAVQIVLRDRKASTSYIQRRLQIGYNRAASIMERMEQEGIVGQPNHAGKREILVGGDDNGER